MSGLEITTYVAGSSLRRESLCIYNCLLNGLCTDHSTDKDLWVFSLKALHGCCSESMILTHPIIRYRDLHNMNHEEACTSFTTSTVIFHKLLYFAKNECVIRKRNTIYNYKYYNNVSPISYTLAAMKNIFQARQQITQLMAPESHDANELPSYR